MHRRLLGALAILALASTLVLSPAPIAAQQTLNAPDCISTFRFTALGSSAITPNGAGCSYWNVTYKATGFTAVTLEFDYANDNNGAPGVLARWPGSQPLTNANSGTLVVTGYAAWAAVRLTELAGTGSVSGLIQGWRQLPPGAIPAPAPVLPSLGLPLPLCNPVQTTGCRPKVF